MGAPPARAPTRDPATEGTNDTDMEDTENPPADMEVDTTLAEDRDTSRDGNTETAEDNMETDEQDGFQTVAKPPKNAKKSRKSNLAKVGPICANHRPYMRFWNYKFSVEPSNIKDGKIGSWIRARAKEFFIFLKSVDDTAVLYPYRPQANEPRAILEAAKFPETFGALQGEGPSARYKDCYFYGLKTWNSRGNTMNINTEIRIGYTATDVPSLIKSWVADQVPQPYLREKDLQAPDTVEVGFLFGCNPLMRDQTAYKRLKKITDNLCIQANEPPVEFAISNRWINDGAYGKRDKNARSSLLQQNRALHVEAIASDKSRTKVMVRKGLETDEWKGYTNVKALLLPTWKDSDDKSRARSCIEKHRSAMADLAWTASDQLINPDHVHKYITNVNSKKRASLRDLIMSIEIDVDTIKEVHGEVQEVKEKDKLFLSLDEMFSEHGKWAFVYPKAYEAQAKNYINGLFVYIRNMVKQDDLTPDEEIDNDISVWFTAQARKEAASMSFVDGKVLTADNISQRDALNILDDVPWFRGQSPPSPSKTPKVDKRIRKYEVHDTDSIHTQFTTHTQLVAEELEQTLARARAMQPNDQVPQKKGVSFGSSTEHPIDMVGDS